MSSSSSIASLIEESLAMERSGDIGAALQRAQEALKGARTFGKAKDIAAALVCVAYVRFRLGHYDLARAMAEESLTCGAPESPARADALRILGNCAHEAGDLVAAERFYHRAIDLGRQLGYHHALQSCLHSLSACVYIPRGSIVRKSPKITITDCNHSSTCYMNYIL